MRAELQRIFQLPANKLRVIPNGVYPEPFRRQAGDARAIRRKYTADDEQVLFMLAVWSLKKDWICCWRLPRILARKEKVKFIIAGKGPMPNIYTTGPDKWASTTSFTLPAMSMT